MRKRAPRFSIYSLRSGDRVILLLDGQETVQAVYKSRDEYADGRIEANFESASAEDGVTYDWQVYRFKNRWAYGMDAGTVRVEEVRRPLLEDNTTYVAFDRAEGAY